MDDVTILGLMAGSCSTFALAPQAFKVWRTQAVDQLSIGMLGLMLCGSLLWLLYGIIRSDVSIIWANGVAFLFIVYMFTKKTKDMVRTGRR